MPKGEPTRAELIRLLEAAEAALAERPETSAASAAPLVAQGTNGEPDEFLEDELDEDAETPEQRKQRLRPYRKKTTWTLPQTVVNGRNVPRPVTVQGKTYVPGRVYTTSAEIEMTAKAAWGANRDAEALLMVDRGQMVDLGRI